LNADVAEQVAAGAAVLRWLASPRGERLAILDAGGDLDRDERSFWTRPGATGLAWLGDSFSGAAAVRAGVTMRVHEEARPLVRSTCP